ncbi:MAG: sigma-70 family RNA polymerase sigma factor [Tepidisphaeraceae bacterium]
MQQESNENQIVTAPIVTRDHVAELAGVADEALLSRYVQGDTGAFATLVARYQRELYHFLARFLGDRAVAEDIFQEAFLQVHESAGTFDPTRRFRPWLFTIAANKARDYLRSKNRHPTAPLDAPIVGNDAQSYVDLLEAASELPSDPMAREELRASVKRVIDEMPANLREVLLLGHFHEFSYKQIADMLHVPLGTVKSRLHAAVGHFARAWRRDRAPKRRADVQ